MPPLVPFIPLITAGIGAATTAYAGYEAAQGPSAPPTTPTPAGQTPATNQAQTAAVTNALPNLQTLTGGSLSPEYAAQWGATQTGQSNNPSANGNIQEAINRFFGLSAPGQSGLTTGPSTPPGGPGILDILAKAVPGGGGGGLTGDLTHGMLNDAFHGFSG